MRLAIVAHCLCARACLAAAPADLEDLGHLGGFLNDSRFAGLREAVEAEKRQNDEAAKATFGQPVVYGGIVELRHVSTGRHVTLDASRVADTEHGCLQVFCVLVCVCV